MIDADETRSTDGVYTMMNPKEPQERTEYLNSTPSHCSLRRSFFVTATVIIGEDIVSSIVEIRR